MRSGVRVVNVRRLRHAALIHGALLGELARPLVPPDRARLALLLDEVRPLLQQLADKAGVFGLVVAAGEHHGAVREDDENQEEAILSSPAQLASFVRLSPAQVSSVSLIFVPGPRLTHRARHQPIFVEAAFEGAVEERRAPARLEPDQFRQARVAAEQERGPSREALLERISYQ